MVENIHQGAGVACAEVFEVHFWDQVPWYLVLVAGDAQDFGFNIPQGAAF